MKWLRRASLWFIGLLLAWEVYYSGPADSVLVNGSLTLAERLVEGSKELPDLLQSGLDFANGLVDRVGHAAVIASDAVMAERPKNLKALDDDVVWALTLASKRTGVSYLYLANTAHLESNFNVNAKAPTSSASGLFQVIESTWLSLLDEHGAQYGWGGYARSIECSSPGRCRVDDPQLRQEILDLRFDGQTATFLAAEFAKENKRQLERNLSRSVSDYELYVAHFLGVAGATKFFRNLERRPFGIAAETFPQAAKANRTVFYGRLGAAKSFREVNQRFQERWNLCKPYVEDFTPDEILLSTGSKDA